MPVTEAPRRVGEPESKPTPAGTDIEHSHARLQPQFRGDVAALLLLSFVDTVLASQEIGAGVLPVGIEEQVVEGARQIVVMRGVAARPAGAN